MTGAQLFAVLLLLSLVVSMYLTIMGVPVTFLQALAGLAVLKGIALFLTPEKPPTIIINGKDVEAE